MSQPRRTGAVKPSPVARPGKKKGKDKMKILSIKVERMTDENPDTSLIGEYTDQPDDWAICRCCGEYLAKCGEEHETPPKGREFRFFKPYAGGEKEGTEEYQKYGKQDYDRMEGLNAGHWWFIGIGAKAQVVTTKTGAGVVQTITSGGLWGIESDSDNAYLRQVEDEQLTELVEELKRLGFGERQIDKALESVDRE